MQKPLILNDLRNLRLIEFSKRIDNNNVNVCFIDNESEVILQIDDSRELGYKYAAYIGDRFVRCKECGWLTKQNKRGTVQFCKEHQGYVPVGTKVIKCVDCGEEIEVKAKDKDTRTCRCTICQQKEVKRIKREYWQKSTRMTN